MQRLTIFIFISLFLTACDDGDIITVELEFDKVLELCEANNESFLIYDTRTDPNESLSLVIPRNTTTEAYFNTATPEGEPETLSINGSTVAFNYRTYNTEPSFCQIIPDSDLVILEDYSANSGTVEITVTITDEDDDGIPTINENPDPNGDGNYDDAQDTDADGIPDYLDQDDDNDNVLTKSEDDDNDEDDNPFTNPRDTDGDGIADYLESDDDNDGVPTRLEDENENGNPLDDFQEDGNNTVPPRFLDNTATEEFVVNTFLSNTYFRTTETSFKIINVGLEILSATTIDFGVYSVTTTID
ncbi:MAG: hypothetical protein HKN99_07965 [Winogradskyella sp.]|nr:hypothetical protein [Winogradskyella sp.]MBT8377180.1 hypothetical protein [Bacteroidia bacterium]NNC45802.1 hypothetical protein [Winogradskyella sp.]NNF86865.1 hypothetical protein [Winogradskyella sp.]NNK39224.1 hypothetical protein [Winogradskyella sp.]